MDLLKLYISLMYINVYKYKIFIGNIYLIFIIVCLVIIYIV